MKVIDVVGGPAATTVDGLASLVLADRSLQRVEINIVDPTSFQLSRREWREEDRGLRAIVMRWCAPGATPGPLVGDGLEHLWTLTVDETLAIGERSVGAEPGAVKHIAFLRRAVPTPEFVASYRHHVELVREHLPRIARYVQNEVRSGDYPGRAIDAVSELTFASVDDHATRWVKGEAGAQEFRSHEGFLDLGAVLQVACAEHVVHHPDAR